MTERNKRKGGDAMRTNLKVFRVQHKLSQAEMAERIGCQRTTYTAVENGARNGRLTFWNALQSAFNLPDTEIWGLMKIDED